MESPRDSEAVVRTTEDGTEYVRTPDSHFDGLPGYPFAPQYVAVDGLRMHYVEEGPPDGEVVLLLHGQPTWSYLYRKMIPPLAAAGHRVIAPDLMGTGRSDKPTSLTIHTLERQVEWTAAFIDALGLRDVTLFCQDWGSIIGLRLVGDRPDTFARVLLANGDLMNIPAGFQPFTIPDRATVQMSDEPLAFSFADLKKEMEQGPQERIRAFEKWIVYALRSPDFSAGTVVDSNTVSSLSKEELAAYDAPYPSLLYRAAPRTFPAMAAGIAGENDSAWHALGRFEKPFLTVFGEHDPLLGSKESQDAITGRIPGAKGQPHERVEADHFIQEDVGPLLADRLNALIAENPIS